MGSYITYLAFMTKQLGVIYHLLEHGTPFARLRGQGIDLLWGRLEILFAFVAEQAVLQTAAGRGRC